MTRALIYDNRAQLVAIQYLTKVKRGDITCLVLQKDNILYDIQKALTVVIILDLAIVAIKRTTGRDRWLVEKSNWALAQIINVVFKYRFPRNITSFNLRAIG